MLPCKSQQNKARKGVKSQREKNRKRELDKKGEADS